MKDAYLLFTVVFGAVALFGLLGIPKKSKISIRALEHTSLLVTIVGSVTTAGLLSLAFLAEQFAVAGGALLLLPGSDLPAANSAVLYLILVGASGLLWAVLGALGVDHSWIRRWAAGCLAVSALVVVLLFPASVALLLSTADAAGAAQSAEASRSVATVASVEVAAVAGAGPAA